LLVLKLTTRLPGRVICFTKLSGPIHLTTFIPLLSSSTTLRNWPGGTVLAS
jgi:hypothetical protein